MKSKPAAPGKPGKAGADSAAREEYADAPSLVAELIACDAYHPRQLVRRSLWQNPGHWLARAALVGGGWMLLVDLAGPLGVVVGAGLVLPFAFVLTIGSHLDQFRGDRALTLVDQVDRWWLTAAQLWPVAFVYLLLAAAFMILATMNRVDHAAQLVAFGGMAFLALAWTESVAYRVLRYGETADAVGAGIQEAGRRIARYPFDFLWNLGFGSVGPGEIRLLSTWLYTGVVTVLWWLMLYFMVTLALGSRGRGIQLLGAMAGGTAAWLRFEAGMGVWVHHYLAYLAERRGLVAEARRALAEAETSEAPTA